MALKNRRTLLVTLSLLLCAAAFTATGALAYTAGQETFPAPPADRTLVYVAGEKSALTPLAVEAGSTPLRVGEVAKGDKRSYVELKGGRSATVVAADEPRFYLFLPDTADAKPPFLVRLTEKNGSRRVAAMAQKGYKGFAIPAEEIIKPHFRVISRGEGWQFMEIRTREPLMPGEYAIIGTDLGRVSTFAVAAR